MKQIYLKCLKKLREFRKTIKNGKDEKKRNLYFSWLVEKTDKIEKEDNGNYIYSNILKYTLKNYKIDEFSYNKASNELKKVIDNNYIMKKNYRIFNNMNISKEEIKLLAKKLLFRRGNVVWIDFGFNIGNEFGGMHPAIILKNFENDLFVLPVSSKKTIEYSKIEKKLLESKISEDECKKGKDRINEIVQLDRIIGFKEIKRWANITRMKKVSLLRLNFSGTIGRVDGKCMETITRKISQEF